MRPEDESGAGDHGTQEARETPRAEKGTCSMNRERYGRRSLGVRAARMLLAAAAMVLVGTMVELTATRADEKAGLKIGLLMDFSGGSAEVLGDRQRGFELAIKHVNDAGGVLGLSVATATGDTTADPETAVAEAGRLIEVERVHAIVGPNSSAASLPIAERVIGPASIPTVSFSATSPELTGVVDHDFFFRVALSDILQGPVLARVVRERGFTNVGLLHVDDAWGRGLAGEFEAAWAGTVRSVAVGRTQAKFAAELRESAGAGARALVVIAPGKMAEDIVREAIENDLYDRFAFGDAAKRPSLVRAIGGARLGGMYGTGPAIAPESPASAAWEAAWVDEHGSLPVRAYVKEAYDATVALALAAEAAGSRDGAAIRDQLRAVGGGPGTVVSAGPQGVADALRVLAGGGAIDYEGASGSMDWDANGDLRRGHIGIWRFTRDERIEEVDAVPFER